MAGRNHQALHMPNHAEGLERCTFIESVYLGPVKSLVELFSIFSKNLI